MGESREAIDSATNIPVRQTRVLPPAVANGTMSASQSLPIKILRHTPTLAYACAVPFKLDQCAGCI